MIPSRDREGVDFCDEETHELALLVDEIFENTTSLRARLGLSYSVDALYFEASRSSSAAERGLLSGTARRAHKAFLAVLKVGTGDGDE